MRHISRTPRVGGSWVWWVIWGVSSVGPLLIDIYRGVIADKNRYIRTENDHGKRKKES